jgi:predicted nuclease of predicted toxin-antitoxin system
MVLRIISYKPYPFPDFGSCPDFIGASFLTPLSVLKMQSAFDTRGFKPAANQARIFISADGDLGTLLARWRDKKPSVMLLQRPQKSPQSQLALLLANLTTIEEALDQGSVVILEATRIRIWSLPIGRDIKDAK